MMGAEDLVRACAAFASRTTTRVPREALMVVTIAEGH